MSREGEGCLWKGRGSASDLLNILAYNKTYLTCIMPDKVLGHGSHQTEGNNDLYTIYGPLAVPPWKDRRFRC